MMIIGCDLHTRYQQIAMLDMRRAGTTVACGEEACGANLPRKSKT